MLYDITYIILRRFDGASVAVVLDNGNVLAVVVDFALLGDHGKLGSAIQGSKLQSYLGPNFELPLGGGFHI